MCQCNLLLRTETCSPVPQCAGNDDVITIKAEDAGDTVSFMFESPNQDRIAGRAQRHKFDSSQTESLVRQNLYPTTRVGRELVSKNFNNMLRSALSLILAALLALLRPAVAA